MARKHVLPEMQKRLKQNPGRALAIDGPAARVPYEYLG